jgi:hypothetical protein
MPETINLDCLSKSSVKRAIRQLKAYKSELTYKCQKLAESLAEKGVEIARVEVAELDAIFTGELAESIHSEYEGSVEGGGVWAVIADSEHAIFVELGTGIVGKESPYIGDFPADVSWNYASGNTIFKTKDGRYGWFYPGDDGKWYFTEGMPSRPFMYNTANELKELIVETAEEVFKYG